MREVPSTEGVVEGAGTDTNLPSGNMMLSALDTKVEFDLKTINP